MRSTIRCVLVMAAAVLCLGLQARASFHLMQIEQVIGGVNGDVTAQAIQLRMRSGFQNFPLGYRIRAWDANGMNPVIVHTFAGPNLPVATAGSRILLCTPSFAALTSPPTVADRTLTSVIPASYLAAGKLTFESTGGTIYWAVAWGGYAGPNTGNMINDPDGQFSPAFMLPLPTTNTSALQFDGLFSDPSTNNAADYIVTAGSSTWTNNAGLTFQLGTVTPTGQCCVGPVCSVSTELACTGLGGSWTNGGACPVGACAPGMGACCNGSACTVRTQADCGTAGGVYRGDGTACTSGEPDNFIECCRANFDEEGGIAVPDIFAFLSEWFANGSRADFDGNGTREVPDIFAFLSAWFAGCS